MLADAPVLRLDALSQFKPSQCAESFQNRPLARRLGVLPVQRGPASASYPTTAISSETGRDTDFIVLTH